MRNILLIILVSLLHSCHYSNAKEQRLEERIYRLEQKMDSLTGNPNSGQGVSKMGETPYGNHCAAVTKKGTQCKRKAGSNGYCWQHGK